jgi:hypothetical protein
MGVEYRLTLAGDIPAEQVAECAVPDPAERPQPWEGRLLAADLYEQRGFGLSVRAGRGGSCYEARDDDGARWEWEPDAYVDVTFSMGKDDRVEESTTNMLTIVARVLEGRSEDAALLLNGGVLLLTRVGGVLRKHNRATWWDHYGFVNDIVPG